MTHHLNRFCLFFTLHSYFIILKNQHFIVRVGLFLFISLKQSVNQVKRCDPSYFSNYLSEIRHTAFMSEHSLQITHIHPPPPSTPPKHSASWHPAHQHFSSRLFGFCRPPLLNVPILFSPHKMNVFQQSSQLNKPSKKFRLFKINLLRS